ncbi:MAG: hypothetical protein OEM23_03780 [Gemmatimonadota bacterium]|nr:hypothetical protein [Gemmatimonadota bacterium]MDH3427534.1 hypothetical protein [Gemmatimonadota bacterium]
MRWLPHAIAAIITLPFAIWILVGEPSGVLPTAAWGLPLAAAYYLGLRIGREVTKGVRRARERSSDRWHIKDSGEDR